MKLSEYININSNSTPDNYKSVDTDGVFGHQCVDQAKDYSRTVLGITLGSFGGSALSGWYNRNNTFDLNKWDRIKNDPTDKNQVPLAGDIVFFSGPTRWGHVGVVKEAIKGQNKITVIDQNTGNGDGKGYDDRIRINEYSYKLVLGWYRAKSHKAEEIKMNDTKLGIDTSKWENTSGFTGTYSPEKEKYIREKYNIPDYYGEVRVLLSPTGKGNANATYIHTLKVMTLYPQFLQHDSKKREAILFHEYGHHVMIHNTSTNLKRIWQKIHEGDVEFMKKINKILKTNYTENAFVTNYASKNMWEDHSESIEESYMTPDKKYNNYADMKIRIANLIMKKYSNFEPRNV